MQTNHKLIEELYWKQMKALTIRTNKELRSFDAHCNGIKI
jgi:hypothetical protein